MILSSNLAFVSNKYVQHKFLIQQITRPQNKSLIGICHFWSKNNFLADIAEARKNKGNRSLQEIIFIQFIKPTEKISCSSLKVFKQTDGRVLNTFKLSVEHALLSFYTAYVTQIIQAKVLQQSKRTLKTICFLCLRTMIFFVEFLCNTFHHVVVVITEVICCSWAHKK